MAKVRHLFHLCPSNDTTIARIQDACQQLRRLDALEDDVCVVDSLGAS
jgi:hypothetical protein